MRKLLLGLMGMGLVLGGCKEDTKTQNELLFPAGYHTWTAGADYQADPPTDDCTGCPEISLNSPDDSVLEAADWFYTLSGTSTNLAFSGNIVNSEFNNNCGPNNNLACENEWRVWPPESGDDAVNIYTPGADITSASFAFNASFECGTSRVVIVAENSYGLARMIVDITRDAGLCTVEPTGANLNVRLLWDTATDQDMHLLRPAGTWQSGNDCYYGNCRASSSNEYGLSSLDWGVTGEATDNPLLDVDDTGGYGPENIFLMAPEEGTYEVWVYYFSGSPATLPTVEAYVDGEFQNAVFYGPDADFLDGMSWHAMDIVVDADGAISAVEVNENGTP